MQTDDVTIHDNGTEDTIKEIQNSLHIRLQLAGTGFSRTVHGQYIIHVNGDMYWDKTADYWRRILSDIDPRLIYVSHRPFFAPVVMSVIHTVQMIREYQVWIYVKIEDKHKNSKILSS